MEDIGGTFSAGRPRSTLEKGPSGARQALLVPSLVGFFASEDGRIVDCSLFPRDVKAIARRIRQLRRGEPVHELSLLIKRLQGRGYAAFVTDDPRLATLARRLGANVQVKDVKDARALQRDLPSLARERGFVKDAVELNRLLREVCILLATEATREALERGDMLLIHAVNTLGNVTKTLNVLVSSIKEWYGLHFPELPRLVDDSRTLIRLISEIGPKGDLELQRLRELGVPIKLAKRIVAAAKRSVGADLSERDIEQIWGLCRSIHHLYQTRDKVQRYIHDLMGQLAPNIAAVAGPLLGAKLISHAGGLDKLAKMPSSRIQVLGAEKALFRALRRGEGVPKHGIIFQHPSIHSARKAKRGKLARALAANIAIAARADAFSSRYIGDDLKARLNELVARVGKVD